MGFFQNIARGLIGAVRGFAGTLPAQVETVRRTTTLAVAAQRAGAVARAAGRAAITPGGQLAIGAGAALAGGALAAPDVLVPAGAVGAPVVMRGGIAGGNGIVARQTTVQTINLATGLVVRSEVLPGSPFLMNSEVRSLRRVAKKVGRAHAKLPRRTVQKSAMKELTDAAVAEALRKVQQPCPPASSHG